MKDNVFFSVFLFLKKMHCNHCRVALFILIIPFSLFCEVLQFNKDQTFTNHKIPFSFTMQFDALAYIEKKGNYESIRIRSRQPENFLIYIQTLPVIRMQEIQMESYCNPVIPSHESFDIVTECKARIGSNDLHRFVRIIKKSNLLYIMFITYRSDHPFPVSNIIWQPLPSPAP